MQITFELEPADIERFLAVLARARSRAACADELDVLEAAKYALDHLSVASVPGYVRKRVAQVQRLIAMLEDEAWALGGPERADVIETLIYFSDPDDLIPDRIEVIGLLDDAIMLELLLRRMRHVSEAYAEFCRFRAGLDAGSGHRARARELAAHRALLHARICAQRACGADAWSDAGV